MATKNTKPEHRPPESPALPVSRIHALQRYRDAAPDPSPLSVTLRTGEGYEYHLDLPRSIAEAIIDPDVPDAFIPVPALSVSGTPLPAGTQRFLHTSYIKEIDVRGLG